MVLVKLLILLFIDLPILYFTLGMLYTLWRDSDVELEPSITNLILLCTATLFMGIPICMLANHVVLWLIQ